MVDDKTKRNAQDRRRVSVSEPYEVNYFARKHGLTKEVALEIIKQAGGDREKANELAELAADGVHDSDHEETGK